MKRTLWLTVLLVVGSAGGLTAQSLFNAVGIGTPGDPIDARSVAMGGLGIGLLGGELLPTDPASAADIALPMLVMTAQPSWVDYRRSSPGESGKFRGTRFPLLGIAYPVFHQGVATLTFGSFLDQRYRANRTVDVPLYDTTTTARDVFESSGGVSSVRLGFARTVVGGLSVGVSYGRYTGTVLRRLQRVFPQDTAFAAYQAGGYWSYSGQSLTGGVAYRLGQVARVAGSVTVSGALKATPSGDTEAGGGYYNLPLEYRIGASAVLARGLDFTAGLARANWAATGIRFKNGDAVRSSTSYGVGLELTQARLLGRTAPLRIGYRKSDLPFGFTGQGSASESAISGGVGLRFQESGDFTLAGLDLTLERGTRKDDLLQERFWRGTLSLKVSGF